VQKIDEISPVYIYAFNLNTNIHVQSCIITAEIIQASKWRYAKKV